ATAHPEWCKAAGKMAQSRCACPAPPDTRPRRRSLQLGRRTGESCAFFLCGWLLLYQHTKILRALRTRAEARAWKLRMTWRSSVRSAGLSTCSAGLQTEVPGKSAFGLLGWETGCSADPMTRARARVATRSALGPHSGTSEPQS